MSYRQRGPGNWPAMGHNQYRHESQQGRFPSTIEGSNYNRFPKPHNGGQQWLTPSPNIPFQNASQVNIPHPPPHPNFQNLPPPGLNSLIQNAFPNPSLNLPPPPFKPNPAVCGPPPLTPSYNFSLTQSQAHPYPPSRHFPPPTNLSDPPPPISGPPAPPLQSNHPPIYSNPPSAGMTFSQHESKRKSDENNSSDSRLVGCQKLDHWLQTRKKSLKPDKKALESKGNTSIQVWSFMNNIKKMCELLTNLSTQVTQMSTTLTSTDEASWETSKQKCELMKEKVNSDFGGLLHIDHLQDLQKKVSKARCKRARIKRARTSKFEEEQVRRLEWAEKSGSISKWQERLRAKIREENKEKRRKQDADRTLSKVSREIHDATRLIDTMLALEKLRLIRRDAAQKRGDNDIGESRQQFEDKIKDMTRLVKAQLECYKEEEAKLKLFLKSEEEEKSKQEQQDSENMARKHQKEEDDKLRAIIFGPDATQSLGDPMLPFTQYYKQAENSWTAFLQIRQEWDSFLVPKGTPASSSIPSSWVMPNTPSSHQWATALK